METRRYDLTGKLFDLSS